MKSLSDQFTDWVRTMPADEAYDYCAYGECAFSQFLRGNGLASNPECDDSTWSDGPNGAQHPMPSRIVEAVNPPGWTSISTFGALLHRLESTPRDDRDIGGGL